MRCRGGGVRYSYRHLLVEIIWPVEAAVRGPAQRAAQQRRRVEFGELGLMQPRRLHSVEPAKLSKGVEIGEGADTATHYRHGSDVRGASVGGGCTIGYVGEVHVLGE